jgi:hypothetical protein
MKRTEAQNKAIHLWYKLKADQCRDAGVTVQMAMQETMELDMTPEMMKEIWRMVQIKMYKKRSTTQLSKHTEIDDIAEHLNRFFAEKFNLEGLEIPNDPEIAPLHAQSPN